MRQLTIRGFDDRLERALCALARERGISLNRAALLLMRQGAGLGSEGGAANLIGAGLGGGARADRSGALGLRLLLDTNAYSALMRNHRVVAATVRRSERVLLSAVVAGELLYGFRHGRRFEENAARLEAFLASPFVELLPVGFATADRFGRIASSLRRNGTQIPTKDIWIAAHAMETGAELLSSDRHFGAIDGLAWLPFSPTEEDSVRERVLTEYGVAAGEPDDG